MPDEYSEFPCSVRKFLLAISQRIAHNYATSEMKIQHWVLSDTPELLIKKIAAYFALHWLLLWNWLFSHGLTQGELLWWLY